MNSVFYRIGERLKIFPPDAINLNNTNNISDVTGYNVMQGFAEAVVRECLIAVNEMMIQNNEEQVKIVDVDKKIKQHFGIKD